jgi:hypothetical protein
VKITVKDAVAASLHAALETGALNCREKVVGALVVK